MNHKMVELWNSVVSPEDRVFHLGDFAFCDLERTGELLAQLNGEKHLVMGNHDPRPPAKYLELGFTSTWQKATYGVWTLQHKPPELDDPRWYLCGHVHDKWIRRGNTINVGVDVWDFTPRTLEEITKAD